MTCCGRVAALPGLMKQIHDDMISAGWVKSSADFNDQLFDGKSFGDISAADLEVFMLLKCLECECEGHADDPGLRRIYKHLGALRDLRGLVLGAGQRKS